MIQGDLRAPECPKGVLKHLLRYGLTIADDSVFQVVEIVRTNTENQFVAHVSDGEYWVATKLNKRGNEMVINSVVKKFDLIKVRECSGSPDLNNFLIGQIIRPQTLQPKNQITPIIIGNPLPLNDGPLQLVGHRSKVVKPVSTRAPRISGLFYNSDTVR